MEEIVLFPGVGGEVEQVVEGGSFYLLNIWGWSKLTYVPKNGDGLRIVCYGSEGRVHLGLGYLLCSCPPFGDRSSPKKLKRSRAEVKA